MTVPFLSAPPRLSLSLPTSSFLSRNSFVRITSRLLSSHALLGGPGALQTGTGTLLLALDRALGAHFAGAGCEDAEGQSACGRLWAEAVVVAVWGEDAHLVS